MADDVSGTSEIQKQISEAVEKATASLKSNRDEILNEKRKLKEQLESLSNTIDNLGGADAIKSLVEMRERLSKDEMGKLLAEGKHEEWFDRRTAAMKKDYEQRFNQVQSNLDSIAKERDRAVDMFSRTKIETEVRAAASKAGIVDSAVEDVLLRANNTFSYDSRGGVVIKDQDGVILIGKDGKTPKNVEEWIEEQRDRARHWFPPSKGAGAEGGMGGPVSLDAKAIGAMSMSEYRAYREKNGMRTGWAGHKTF